MKALMLVGLGGAIGSMTRYLLSAWVMRFAEQPRFPLGTFAVNILGCVAAGALAGWAARSGALSADLRALLFAGMLGGFTTFSAFGLETVLLLKRGDFVIAALNVMLSVAAGLLAVWIGFSARAA